MEMIDQHLMYRDVKERDQCPRFVMTLTLP